VELPAAAPTGPLDELVVSGEQFQRVHAYPWRAESCSGVSQLLARVRALAFYAVTVLLSLPLFVSMLCITPFQLAFDKHRRAALHFVNDLWAVASTCLFYRVEARAAPRCSPAQRCDA
jgi:hypothetical protein